MTYNITMLVFVLLSQTWRKVELGVDSERQPGRTFTLVDSRGNPLGIYRRGGEWVLAWYDGASWDFTSLQLPDGWAWLIGSGDTLYLLSEENGNLKLYRGLGSSWDTSATPLAGEGPRDAALLGDSLAVGLAVPESGKVYVYYYYGGAWSSEELPGPPGSYATLAMAPYRGSLAFLIFSDSGLYWREGSSWELVDSVKPSSDYDGKTARLSTYGNTAFIGYSADTGGSSRTLIRGMRDTAWHLDTVGEMCLSCWYWSVLVHAGGFDDMTSTTDILLDYHRDSWESSGTCSQVGEFDQTPVNLAVDSAGYFYAFAWTLGDTFRLYTTRGDIQSVEEEGTSLPASVRYLASSDELLILSNEEFSLEIWDCAGRRVLSKTVRGGARLSLSALKPGVYFVRWPGGRLKLAKD